MVKKTCYHGDDYQELRYVCHIEVFSLGHWLHVSDVGVVNRTCFTKVSCVLHSSSGLDKSRTRTTDILLASG